MKKRNLFLAVALIALMTGVLSAQTYDSESDFQVTKNGNAITITKYVGTKTAVNIPPTIQNTTVTTIGNNAFQNLKSLASVTIPNGIGGIGSSAFSGCTSLTSITIPASVTSFGNTTFNNCPFLISVTFSGTIPSAGFNFPFEGDLREKFYATDKAKGTPGTYTRAQGGTTWTLRPTTTAATSQYDSESDFEVTKRATTVAVTGYKGSKTAVNIPPRIQNLPVTEIDNNAFQSNTSITNVTIPNGVTDINADAFRGCTKLTSVTLPNSVETIGSSAFRNCTSLTNITIPSSVNSIGDRVFMDCTNLTSITFQGVIPSVGFTSATSFPGDLRDKFYATDKAKGTAGTYTRPNGTSTTWTKK